MDPGRGDGAEDRPRLLIACACLVAAVTVVWGLRVFMWADTYPGFGDVFRYYYPVYEFFYSNLASGRLLLWNPYQLTGIPTVATLQGGFFYPPHALYLVLPTAVAMGALGISHLLWIAISTLLFARALGLSPPAALVAGVLCALAPAYHDMLLAPNMLESAAWLPIGALASLKLARQASRRWLAGLAGAAAMSILAGYPQFAIYSFYVWGGVFVIELARTTEKVRQWPVAIVGFAAALGVGALLAAIQLAPALELAEIGLRNLEVLDVRHLFPGGKPKPDLLPLLGPVAASLLCASLFSRNLRVMALTLLGLGIASFLVSFGWSPAFDLFLSLPFVGSFRYPNRIVFVTSFCIAVLVGIGLDTITERMRAARHDGGSPQSAARAATLAAAALAFVSSIWMLASGLSPMRSALGLAVAALLVLHWKVRGAAAVGFAVAIGVAAESLILPIRYWELPYSESTQTHVYREPPSSLVDLAGRTSRTWAVGLSAGKPPLLPKNAASLLGLRSIDGYEPLGLSWQRAYWDHLVSPSGRAPTRLGFTGLPATAGALRKSRAARRSRLLDLAAMRWLVASAPLDARLRGFLSASNMRHVGSSAGATPLLVFESSTALPRAFATYRAEPAPPAGELLERLAQRSFDPLEISYVEAGPALDSAPGSARGHPLEIIVDDPSRVEIRATLAAPALVVLADTYHPGWKASIDDDPAEVYRANQMFRGVYVPAGSHRILFEFEHPRFWQGLAISVATLAALVLFVARSSPKSPAPG